MLLLKYLALFVVTALCEILGCWLVLLALKRGWHAGLIAGAVAALAAFAWLLTLHPSASAGRVYAAYGGVYVAMSVVWMWLVEGGRPDRWDLIGAGLCVAGTLVIYAGPRSAPG